MHGQVHPLRTATSPTAAGLEGLLRGAAVPVWLPWPLPTAGWSPASPARATSGAGPGAASWPLSGPNPVGGPGEMLLVSEELGVGLGAGCAGLAGPDPGSDFAAGPPHALVRFGHHEFPLWHVDAPGRAAFAGEMMGNWLWLILWPDTAGMLLVDPLELRDLRDPGLDLDLPFGAPSPRLP